MKQISSNTGICHFLAAQGESLKSFLSRQDLSELDLTPSPSLIEHWLHSGGVYVDGHRQREDMLLASGQVLRLHTRRKRYAVTGPADLRQRIVELNDDFLVFDKPSGLPTHPTLDNYIENALYLLQQALQIPLHTTHRLDVPTAGLLIFARHKDAQVAINREFAKGRVEKIYQAQTETPVNMGLHTHFIDPETKVPRAITSTPHANWWECRLEVLSISRLPSGWNHVVRLLTGKTHQIRAQFSALHSPLLGDLIYGGANHPTFGLQCSTLSFQVRGTKYSFTRPEVGRE